MSIKETLEQAKELLQIGQDMARALDLNDYAKLKRRADAILKTINTEIERQGSHDPHA